MIHRMTNPRTGAEIEGNFKPYYVLVDGEPRTRPIDSLLENLNELYSTLKLSVDNPSQSKQALDQSQPVRDLCAAKFKDYQFGLKLISQNTGQQEFVIGRDAVDAPDKVLSDWVVASYRKE